MGNNGCCSCGDPTKQDAQEYITNSKENGKDIQKKSSAQAPGRSVGSAATAGNQDEEA